MTYRTPQEAREALDRLHDEAVAAGEYRFYVRHHTGSRTCPTRHRSVRTARKCGGRAATLELVRSTRYAATSTYQYGY